MGLWVAKLAGHENDAKVQLRKPDAVLAYILAFGSVFFVLFLLLVGIVLTAVRIYKIFVHRKQSEENLKSTLDRQVAKNFMEKVRKRLSSVGQFRDGMINAGLEMVELTTTPGPVARLKSTKLGIKLEGGKGHNFIHGDPGIFVSRVRPGSLADGRLYPGDRIVAINNFCMGMVTLKYAKEVMQAVSQAEGRLMFSILRAPVRERKVSEAFSLYCDDENTGKHEVVFTKDHLEVFEEAFSIYDHLGTGKIPMSSFFPLLRSLGYNIHKEEAFRYMNELDLADKQKITFNELIKFLEHIVAEQTSKSEVRCVYNVFDPEKKGQVPVIELFEALERMYGHNITVDEIETILSMGDRDKDGCLNEEDFERLLLPSLILY